MERRFSLFTRIPTLWLVSTCLVACVPPGSSKSTQAVLADGEYVVVGGSGYPPLEESNLKTVTARLDHAARRLVFTVPDGGSLALTFAPRPQEEWRGDCATMNSVVKDETADLSPAPLQLQSMTFTTPVVYAKCGPDRMILSNGNTAEGTYDLILDHR